MFASSRYVNSRFESLDSSDITNAAKLLFSLQKAKLPTWNSDLSFEELDHNRTGDIQSFKNQWDSNRGKFSEEYSSRAKGLTRPKMKFKTKSREMWARDRYERYQQAAKVAYVPNRLSLPSFNPNPSSFPVQNSSYFSTQKTKSRSKSSCTAAKAVRTSSAHNSKFEYGLVDEVQRIMDIKKLTQSDIATLVNIPQPYISMFLNRRWRATFDSPAWIKLIESVDLWLEKQKKLMASASHQKKASKKKSVKIVKPTATSKSQTRNKPAAGDASTMGVFSFASSKKKLLAPQVKKSHTPSLKYKHVVSPPSKKLLSSSSKAAAPPPTEIVVPSKSIRLQQEKPKAACHLTSSRHINSNNNNTAAAAKSPGHHFSFSKRQRSPVLFESQTPTNSAQFRPMKATLSPFSKQAGRCDDDPETNSPAPLREEEPQPAPRSSLLSTFIRSKEQPWPRLPEPYHMATTTTTTN